MCNSFFSWTICPVCGLQRNRRSHITKCPDGKSCFIPGFCNKHACKEMHLGRPKVYEVLCDQCIEMDVFIGSEGVQSVMSQRTDSRAANHVEPMMSGALMNEGQEWSNPPETGPRRIENEHQASDAVQVKMEDERSEPQSEQAFRADEQAGPADPRP